MTAIPMTDISITSATATIASANATLATVIPPVARATAAIALANQLSPSEIHAFIARATTTMGTVPATRASVSHLSCSPGFTAVTEVTPPLTHSKQDTAHQRGLVEPIAQPKTAAQPHENRTVTASIRYCKPVTRNTLSEYSSAIAHRLPNPSESPASQPHFPGRVGCAASLFSGPHFLRICPPLDRSPKNSVPHPRHQPSSLQPSNFSANCRYSICPQTNSISNGVVLCQGLFCVASSESSSSSLCAPSLAATAQPTVSGSSAKPLFSANPVLHSAL